MNTTHSTQARLTDGNNGEAANTYQAGNVSDKSNESPQTETKADTPMKREPFAAISHSLIGYLALVEMAVYLVLVKYAWCNNNRVRITMNQIAEEANISKRSVVKGVAGLEELGVITVERSKESANRNAINIYSLTGIGADVALNRQASASSAPANGQAGAKNAPSKVQNVHRSLTSKTNQQQQKNDDDEKENIHPQEEIMHLNEKTTDYEEIAQNAEKHTGSAQNTEKQAGSAQAQQEPPTGDPEVLALLYANDINPSSIYKYNLGWLPLERVQQVIQASHIAEAHGSIRVTRQAWIVHHLSKGESVVCWFKSSDSNSSDTDSTSSDSKKSQQKPKSRKQQSKKRKSREEEERESLAEISAMIDKDMWEENPHYDPTAPKPEENPLPDYYTPDEDLKELWRSYRKEIHRKVPHVAKETSNANFMGVDNGVIVIAVWASHHYTVLINKMYRKRTDPIWQKIFGDIPYRVENRANYEKPEDLGYL
jgi:DNA-binding MarR family transcriptional regulator